MDKNYGYKHTKGFIVFIVITIIMALAAAYAQQPTMKPVMCSSLKSLLEVITSDQYKELPIWRGVNDETGNKTVLFYNKQTTSWTIIEYRNETGCILGSAGKSELSVNTKVD